MKSTLLNTIAAAALTIGLTGCVNDLDISSIDPQTSTGATDMELLSKCYSTLGVTGQSGPAGNADLAGIEDEGESGFYRTTFNCQELMTDECAWAWQDNPDIAPFTNMTWNSNSVRTLWVYTRLTYNITLFNSYLNQVADNAENSQYRAEVRFLRALNYWYLLDLFGKSPYCRPKSAARTFIRGSTRSLLRLSLSWLRPVRSATRRTSDVPTVVQPICCTLALPSTRLFTPRER